MGDLKDKFTMQYMGDRQLLKIVGTHGHINQRNDESIRDFYACFNKELEVID